MKLKSKPLADQVLVITGATSGIGLATAREAARRGARLVLNARNEAALQQLVDEVQLLGGEAIAVPGDVGRYEDVCRLGSEAVRKFGGFDTWINNAGVTIYGRLREVPLEDHRQLFETNYWGVVHGSLVAVEHLRREGGTLINVGSALSDRAIPLQGAYCASKHAVKGFTDALRVEVEKEGMPISVTLVKPSAIDTPYRQHAKVYMPVEPSNPPPVYDPAVAAEAILHCAEHPKRDVFVGAGGKLLSLGDAMAPRGMDQFLKAFFFWMQKIREPVSPERGDGLYRPASNLQERGGYPGHVAGSSLYTLAALHPLTTAAVALGAVIGLAISLRSPR